jgi:hypothetical protein
MMRLTTMSWMVMDGDEWEDEINDDQVDNDRLDRADCDETGEALNVNKAKELDRDVEVGDNDLINIDSLQIYGLTEILSFGSVA